MDVSVNANLAYELSRQLNIVEDKINTIDANIVNYNTHIDTALTQQFLMYKKDYTDTLKIVLTSHNVDQVTPIIKEGNVLLLERINSMIRDTLPKYQDNISQNIQANFSTLKTAISTETTKLLNSALSRKTIDDFIHNVTTTLGQTHNTMATLISTSDARIETTLNETDKKMGVLQSVITDNIRTQQTLQINVGDMLKKFENSSAKGNASEQLIYNILISLFPCAQIDHVGNDKKETGDIMFERKNKPRILIENKDYESKNVQKTEVEKFIRDCGTQNCCGIMFSQNNGIANKDNFELQIHNKHVLLYVHEVNFEAAKIKMAIEIVENFKQKLDEMVSVNAAYQIDNDTLTDINKEFSIYTTQKNSLLKMSRDFNERMIISIGELALPNLEKYLSSKFAVSSKQCANICEYCEKYIPKSLPQHYRFCAAKKEFDIELANV